MDPSILIALALEGLKLSLALIAELRAQSGMSDEQLLAFALTKDQATRDAVAAHIAAVKASQA